ncbi:uncharacterized protein LACBIDRAFT_295817 [Laccaria bicolor S238N-H82]|uniref:Predicted protein n=1 Tax=Laccaria bicolor (strain S238N-H82 / ATCC MYA-4686) TaxID=486041 RepID=B0DYR5_LACBS|nr:uncharacterized protein LACBIDRAFT_295817 [Laccaria bicolor S238N-H82]EDR00336.1 predicted protein [Laccaria bicolor S238N-H82]|eukprot:XP_001889088.1 predicted protein [Laccaria bicolor S238N-H82]
MRSFLVIFTVLISAMLTSALVARTGPSNVPCHYSCPLKDTANHNLNADSESDNPINCHYKGGGLCKYSKTTGAVTFDQDDGHCPSKAICSNVRRAALPRSPRRNVARQVDAGELKLRDQLGSAKRGKRSD